MTQNQFAQSMTNNRVPRAVSIRHLTPHALSFPLPLVVQDFCLPAWCRACPSDKTGDGRDVSRVKKMVNVPSATSFRLDDDLSLGFLRGA